MTDAADAKLDAMVDLLRELLATSKPQPAMIGISEFADLMSIGESTLERLKATPQIGPQPVKVGGSLRWIRAEVLAWMNVRNHRSELHDARTWPAAWKQLQKS